MTTRGELIPAQETMPGSPGLEFEFVPHKNNLKKIYLRLNGKRIAYRGRPNSPRAATWVSIWFGYKVKDNAARDGVVVYFGDVRINYRSSFLQMNVNSAAEFCWRMARLGNGQELIHPCRPNSERKNNP